MTAGTLRVPGASLYYTVRGTGPVLLILQGGPGNADGSDRLAGYLADQYTVVSYDRRGLSRSEPDDRSASPGIETHSDDAHHLLAALTSEPALVFGSSIGALIGLALVTRHPDQVRTLIAHEPPTPHLLPDSERTRAQRAQLDVEDTHRSVGPAAAMMKLMTMAGVDFVGDREPDVEMSRPDPRRGADMEFFLTHDAAAVRCYTLDTEALKAVPTQIVPAGGRTSRDAFPHHCAGELARLLGTELTEFAGGHSGYVLRPTAFAAELRAVLAAQAP